LRSRPGGGLAKAGLDWLRERWAPRLIATASGGLVTALAVYDIVDWHQASQWGAPAWLAWIGAAYVLYRRLAVDLYVLAGAVLSVLVVVTAFLGNTMRFNDAGVFLFLGLVVIGLSGAGGWWLRTVAGEEAGS
jgi:hypothetical protein